MTDPRSPSVASLVERMENALLEAKQAYNGAVEREGVDWRFRHLISAAEDVAKAVKREAASRLAEGTRGDVQQTQFTRLTVIDENGSVIERRNQHVELSVQDDGRTLKVFLRSLASMKIGEISGYGVLTVGRESSPSSAPAATPAGDICWCRKNPCVCLKHDAECETELTSHGYTPCRCAERAGAPADVASPRVSAATPAPEALSKSEIHELDRMIGAIDDAGRALMRANLRAAALVIDKLKVIAESPVSAAERPAPTWQPIDQPPPIGERVQLGWKSGFRTCGYFLPKKEVWVTPNGEYTKAHWPDWWTSFTPLPAAPSPGREETLPDPKPITLNMGGRRPGREGEEK